MKALLKSVRGVTLLEVMLVLAIAAMIIMMSVRYYQTTSSNQQANALINQVLSISASADQLAQVTGKFDNTETPVTTDALRPLLPTNGLITPWGTDIDITTVTATSITIAVVDAPAAICPLVKMKLVSNGNYDLSGVTCDASAATAMDIIYYSASH